jgi:hypothetical protein
MESIEVTIPATAERTIDRCLRHLSISYFTKTVEIILMDMEKDGTICNTPLTTIHWGEQEFNELMSANPVWAPTKPAGVFRSSDIFAYLDYLEEQSND